MSGGIIVGAAGVAVGFGTALWQFISAKRQNVQLKMFLIGLKAASLSPNVNAQVNAMLRELE